MVEYLGVEYLNVRESLVYDIFKERIKRENEEK